MTKRDYFEQQGTVPDYKDPDTLMRFLSTRMRILPRERTGVTAKNQRKLAKAISYARYLGLLPYTSYQRAT